MISDEQDQQQKRKGRAPRFVRAMARRHYLPAAAVVLAVAVGVALAAPRALSDAAGAAAATAAATGTQNPTTANDDSVTWTPGTASQNPSASPCNITADGTITTSTSAAEAWIRDAVLSLSYEPGQVIDDPGQVIASNTQQYSIARLGPPDSSGTSITGQANVTCSILSTGGAWSSGAVGALAATYAYLAISTIVTGATWAYSATLPVGQADELFTVIPSIAGCIGAAVATPILLSIGGGDASALAAIAAAAPGCLLDARDAQVDPTALGAWLSTELSTLIPGASQIGGTELTDAASASGTDLSPMTTAMTDAATGLAATP